ncbi:MAG: hypothetical protein DPW14_05710 [Planctomycetes bacterium]|nr:hypothetical protein [Planctomycetota bacterium]
MAQQFCRQPIDFSSQRLRLLLKEFLGHHFVVVQMLVPKGTQPVFQFLALRRQTGRALLDESGLVSMCFLKSHLHFGQCLVGGLEFLKHVRKHLVERGLRDVRTLAGAFIAAR